MSIRNRFQSWAGNRRNESIRKMYERGKLPRRDVAASEVASRAPGYRNRTNPATGRPHRDDARLTRTRNEELARLKQARDRAAGSKKATSRWDDPPPGERRQQRPEPARQRRPAPVRERRHR
jgi:hypothetical protein